MSSKKYGISYERKRKKMLEEQGCVAFRCRGSFGPVDILAYNKDNWIMESIKSTKQDKYYANTEIEKLKKLDNVPPYTIRRLVVFVKGKMRVAWEHKTGFSSSALHGKLLNTYADLAARALSDTGKKAHDYFVRRAEEEKKIMEENKNGTTGAMGPISQ